MNGDAHAVMRGHIRTISNRAWDGLRHSQNLHPPLINDRGLRFGRPRLQLWRSADGFHDYEPHTLTVFHPFDGLASPLLRKAVWNRSDVQRAINECLEHQSRAELPDPMPTFEVSDVSIDRENFEAHLNEAVDFRIPIVWPWQSNRSYLTEDAGKVGFEYFDLAEPQASVRCAWSVDPPPEWQEVAVWFRRMFEWLERQLTAASSGSDACRM